MANITLTWAHTVKKGEKQLGVWRDSVMNGQMRFAGRLNTQTEWSAWMRKGELRKWFESQSQ